MGSRPVISLGLILFALKLARLTSGAKESRHTRFSDDTNINTRKQSRKSMHTRSWAFEVHLICQKSIFDVKNGELVGSALAFLSAVARHGDLRVNFGPFANEGADVLNNGG